MLNAIYLLKYISILALLSASFCVCIALNGLLQNIYKIKTYLNIITP